MSDLDKHKTCTQCTLCTRFLPCLICKNWSNHEWQSFGKRKLQQFRMKPQNKTPSKRKGVDNKRSKTSTSDKQVYVNKQSSRTQSQVSIGSSHKKTASVIEQIGRPLRADQSSSDLVTTTSSHAKGTQSIVEHIGRTPISQGQSSPIRFP